MSIIAKSIFKAVHEGKWLDVEYLNGKQEITRFWAAVKGIDCQRGVLSVEGCIFII